MRLYLAFLLAFLSTTVFSYEVSCKTEQTLTIGCTSDCDRAIKNSLKKVARKHNQRVRFVDMWKKNIKQNFDSLDAIIIPGGIDIDPKYYKDDVEEDLRAHLDRLDYLVDYTRDGKRRDPFEMNVLGNYFSNKNNNKLPLLAICRGMQILTVSQGIPLYIDINKEIGIPNRRRLQDKISIPDSDSLIGQVLNYSSFYGYKNHHQGLRVPYFKKHQAERWPHIKITATSNKGRIAEAIEFDNRPIVATQFHPEIDRGDENSRIFSWVLDNSCKRNKSK